MLTSDDVRHGSPSVRRSRVFPALAALILAAAAGCSSSGGASLDASGKRVAAHLKATTGVKVASGSCTPGKAPNDQTCTVTTDQGKKVVVRTVEIGGEQYFETVSGLIDGQTLIGRLENEYGSTLRKQVTVDCPDVVQANDGDTTTCHVTVPDDGTHTITVKILDDKTGDYTVIAPPSSRPPKPTPPSIQGK
jgi:hypothetical protein